MMTPKEHYYCADVAMDARNFEAAQAHATMGVLAVLIRQSDDSLQRGQHAGEVRSSAERAGDAATALVRGYMDKER